MSRSLTLILVLTLLTTGFLAVPGLAAQHEARDDRRDQGPQDQRPDEPMGPEDRRAWAEEKRSQAVDRAEAAGLFGQLSYQDGVIDGSFIAANLDTDTGTVTDHAVVGNDTLVVLDRVEIDASVDGDVTVRPATLVLPFEDGELRINDNPTAMLHYRSTAPVTVEVTVADGYTITVNENATKARITGDLDATLLLAGAGTLSEDGGILTAELSEAGTVLFRADPDEPGRQVSQAALDHAAEQGRLGGELRVSGAGGEAVDQETPVDVEMRAQYANHGQAIVEVDGDHEDGRVVHLTIAKDNLQVADAAEIEPKLDRESIPRAASIDDVVNATSNTAVAHVAVLNRVVEVTVWIPEFSLHSLNIQDATQTVPDIPEPLSSPNPTGLGIDLAQQTKDRALSQANAWSQLGVDARTQAMLNARQAGLFGQANLELGQLQGAYVQATVDANAGALEAVRLVEQPDTRPVFEQVRPTTFTQAQAPQKLGPAIALLSEDVALTIHDTPNAQLEIKAGDAATTVELDVADGAVIERVDDRALQLTTQAGTEVHLSLVAGAGELIVEGTTVVVSLGANAAFQAVASAAGNVPGQANLEERLQAARNGTLGAEASITAVDGTAVVDRVETSVTLEPREIGAASVTVTATSQVPDPRVITLNLDPDLVGQKPASELEVLVDGQAIQAASSASAVLQGSSARASFHAQAAGDGLQVLVNLQGFSDHDVTVSGEDDTTDDGTDDEDTTTDPDGDEDEPSEETDDASFLGLLAVVGVVGLVAAARKR